MFHSNKCFTAAQLQETSCNLSAANMTLCIKT